MTKSQEELLETIENLQFPFGGISKMKDLRTKTKLRVFVTDREEMLRDWVDYMNQYNTLHDEFYWGKLAFIPGPINGGRECAGRRSP